CLLRVRVTHYHHLDFLEEIAMTFHLYSIGAMTVVSSYRIVGIVTQKDLLNTFLELTGMTEPGSIIEVNVEDRTGVIYDIGRVFKELNIRIISVSVYRNRDMKGYKTVVLRI